MTRPALPPAIGLTGSWERGRRACARHLAARWGYRRLCAETGGRLVNPDVRWPSEVAMIHQLGGVIWRVELRHGPPLVAGGPEADPLSPDALIVIANGNASLRAAVDLLLGAAGPEGAVS